MPDDGDIRVFNPNREISKEITLEILIRHRNVMKQARTGEIEGNEPQINNNIRKLNQVKALNLIISAQREMVTISRPIIYFRSTQQWKRSHKSEKDKIEIPFEKFECDYKIMITWLEQLKACEQDILTAERTKSLEDDFMVTKEMEDGKVNQLTNNFYDMLNELETSYEQIYLLMLTNKIVSAGIEEDEEATYKEKEKEAIRRVIEA